MYRLLSILVLVLLTQLSCTDGQYAQLLMEVDRANARLYQLQRHQTSRFAPDLTTKAYESLNFAKQLAKQHQFQEAKVHLNAFHTISQEALADSVVSVSGRDDIVFNAVELTDYDPVLIADVSPSSPTEIQSTLPVKSEIKPTISVKASQTPNMEVQSLVETVVEPFKDRDSSNTDLAVIDISEIPKIKKKTTPILSDIQPRVVVVEQGDWLMKISRQFSRFSISWEDIFLANNKRISNPNLIYPGQKLIIP